MLFVCTIQKQVTSIFQIFKLNRSGLCQKRLKWPEFLTKQQENTNLEKKCTDKQISWEMLSTFCEKKKLKREH